MFTERKIFKKLLRAKVSIIHKNIWRLLPTLLSRMLKMCQKTWGGELLLQVLTLDSSYFSEAHSTQWDEIYFKGSSLVAENLALIALLWICFVWWNVIQFCFPGGILISIGFNDIMNSRRVRVHWLDGNGWPASSYLMQPLGWQVGHSGQPLTL